MGPAVTNHDRWRYGCSIITWIIILGFVTSMPHIQAAQPPVPLFIQADYMERRPADNTLRFQGSVDVKYGESRIFADVVEVNTETGDGFAEGNVRFEDPQRKVAAERAESNLFTRVGTLYDTSGSLKGKSLTHRRGEVPQPVTFYFAAERFVRETESRSLISRGS